MERFFLSDHHYRHKGIYTKIGDDGLRIRPWADTPEEADEMMIAAHNAVVAPKDTIYFMGDVAFNKKGLLDLNRMNGRKIMLRGNHDKEKAAEYLKYFEDIRATHEIGEVVFSHWPLNEQTIDHFIGNVHGHLHEKLIMRGDVPDPRFLNLSVEIVGITPLHYDEVVARLRANLDAAREIETPQM